MLLAGIVLAATPAEAKYTYTFAGHPAVRYEWADLPSNINKYVHYVDFDVTGIYCDGSGVRLYLFDSAKYAINSPTGNYIASNIASYIRSRSEWVGDRSHDSVKMEIMYHSKIAVYDPSKINPTHIEYYYYNLQWWERPIYGYI